MTDRDESISGGAFISPFVTSRTPFRVSFFGGGTDYPDWYRAHGGAVLSTTIDKYCYISCRYLPPFFDSRHRIVWSHIERVNSISEILHPAVREGMRMLGFTDEHGLEIHHQGDLPARAGMGSSSSFAVGLILALKTLLRHPASKHDLAEAALTLEQDRLRDAVGSQDQVAAAYGGLNVIRFATDGGISVEPIGISDDRGRALRDRLMLFYTGASRIASEVAAEILRNLGSRAEQLDTMGAMVDQALAILSQGGDLDEFGALLHESWMLKRSLGDRVSSLRVEELYQAARGAGAIGGKLLGAGSTGFMLFYVPEGREKAVEDALRGCLHVPFAFERDGAVLVGGADRAA